MALSSDWRCLLPPGLARAPGPTAALYHSGLDRTAPGWSTSDSTAAEARRHLEVNSILTVFPTEHVNIDDSDQDGHQSATVLINLGSAPFVVKKGT